MWTRSLLKANAKRALSAKWGSAIAVCLIAGLCAGLSSSLLTRLTESSFITVIGSFLLTVLLNAFLDNIIEIGLCRYMMENRLGHPPISTLFSGYQTELKNLFTVRFLVTLKIDLGFLLVIPGIYWSYKYAMVSYLLAENPTLSYRRATELSGQMMEGEKLRLFVLQLSFFGWWLLSLLTAGLLFVFYVTPYMQATMAEFYAAMRAKAFSMGITDESELGGFYTY